MFPSVTLAYLPAVAASWCGVKTPRSVFWNPPENAIFNLTLVPISGAQNRRIKPPFAFNADETLIAVPAGDTGFNVVDTQTWEIRSSIPTPSRVYQLDFVGDEVASIDGANESAILRIQPWKPEDLIKRACDFWPQATLPRHRTGVPEPQGRQAFCRQRD